LREHGIDPDDPRLDQEIRRLEAGATSAQPNGAPGDPILQRSAFRTAFQAALGVLLAVVLAWTVFLVRDVVLILMVALFLATGLSPAVEFLRRRGFGSVLAPTVVIVGVLGVVLATIVAGLPPLVGQADALRAQIPEYVRQGVERNTTLRDLDERVGLIERVEDVTEEQAGSEVLQEQPPERVLGLAMGVAKGVFAVVTALVLMLYFLGNYRGLKRAAYVLVPRSRRARVTLLTDEILDRIGMYVLGNLATSAVAGVAAALVLCSSTCRIRSRSACSSRSWTWCRSSGPPAALSCRAPWRSPSRPARGSRPSPSSSCTSSSRTSCSCPASFGVPSMSPRRPRSWPSSSVARCSASSARCSPFRRRRPSSSCAPRWSCRVRRPPDHAAVAGTREGVPQLFG
jgi:AI-2E family transporter